MFLSGIATTDLNLSESAMNFRLFLRPRLLTLCWLWPAAGFSAGSPATPVEVQKLVEQYGCLSCHGLVHKQVGPGFSQIAERYRNDPTAAATLATRLQNGTVGRWGRLVMPRQPHMTEAESLTLARWVLARP